MYKLSTKSSGIYKIKDNIERFQIKVNVRQVESVLQLPKYVTDFGAIKGSAEYRENESADKNDTTTEVILWQQKIFSSKERVLYRDEGNCKTEQQKRYQKMLKEEELQKELGLDTLKKGKNRRKRRRNQKFKESQDPKINESALSIFTYVHEDGFTPENEENMRKRDPSDSNGKVSTNMYICASLNPDTILVALKWFPKERILHIYPDFNLMDDNPYFIEIDSDYRHLYCYAVVNISEERSPTGSEKLAGLEFLPIYKELIPYWNKENEINETFQMPPRRNKRISLFFEIKQGLDFEYDNVHVRYYIDLPEECTLEEGLLAASTHSSKLGSKEFSKKSHYFGYNWQLSLLCLEDFNFKDKLRIYFEVISIDSWERERSEGFGYFSTFLCPGSDNELINCIRPADSLLDSLYRYFIGGRKHFEYKKFFGINSECKLHNRYRCRMQQTGKLDISVTKITQGSWDLIKPQIKRPSAMTLDDIMMAFREATSRLKSLAV